MSLYFLCLVRLLRVTLVWRLTARSLQNNIVGYVPPSGERSCNKCVKLLSVGYKFVDTHLNPCRQWFNIYLICCRTPSRRVVAPLISAFQSTQRLPSCAAGSASAKLYLLTMLLEPSHWVCKPAYLMPVPSQDKVGGLQHPQMWGWRKWAAD